ncbi:hypothetical protein F2Q68_00005043 [Brassica cretica]|uniref:Uncharacterized protein n=1 Tax=Brassica cretica TaxID=69181 RepID=A0A8S9JF10_BRACR|nr:hypothetical protein F2Q68_00005043 [Brassica cretica]
MAASVCRAILDSPCRSMEVSASRAIRTISGLGGCGCFAANSSCVRILTALQDAVDSVGVIGRCSGVPVDQFGLAGVDRCSKSGHQTQGLQPPENLSTDLLHYAYDPPGHAGHHYHLVPVSKSQPCLAVQYRSMSGMEYRSMSDGRCWSTEDECLWSTVVSEYRSTVALGRIRISGKFRVSGSGSGSVGSVDLISGSGFVVSGYPGFGYPSRYSIIRGYPDPFPLSSRTSIKVATTSRGSVSIDVRTEVSIDDGRCRSTEDECLRSIRVSEYRSMGLVSGSTVVDRNRSMNRWCYRSMRSVLLCGLNAPSLQDLYRTQGLQPPEYLSSDMLLYADDPSGHAVSIDDGRCRSTEDECLRSIGVSEYRSMGLVSGSTVVNKNRSMNRWCYPHRSMRSVLLCGLNAPSLQDLAVFENSYSADFESAPGEGQESVRIAEVGFGVKATVNQKNCEPLALDCLGWDSVGLYLLVGDCNWLSNARLLTPHLLLFQVTSSELVEVAGG